MRDDVRDRLLGVVVIDDLVNIRLCEIARITCAIGSPAASKNLDPIGQALKISRVGDFCFHGAIVAAAQKRVKSETFHSRGRCGGLPQARPDHSEGARKVLAAIMRVLADPGQPGRRCAPGYRH